MGKLALLLLGWTVARVADPAWHTALKQEVVTREDRRRMIRSARRSRRAVRRLRRQLESYESALEAAGVEPPKE